MITLLQIIGISFLAILWVRELGYRFVKPLSCELCMAFWMSAFWFHSIEGILYASVSGLIATLLNKYI
jgi:hypothetical protein